MATRMCLIETVIVLALYFVGSSTATPQISTTNVLLPPFANLEHRVQLTKGCWTVREDSYDLGADDDLIDVLPTQPITRTENSGVECVVVQAEDELCHRDFKIRVRNIKKQGFRSLIFAKMSDPEDPRLVEMRVDVRVSELVKLEILTTTKRVEVGEKEILQVIGRDKDENVFSSLAGLDLHWHIESGAQFIELQSLLEANIVNMEESALDKARQSAVGLSTGRATVSVRLDSLEARVELMVSRSIIVCPGPSVSLLTDSTFEPLFCLNRMGCFTSGRDYRQKFPAIPDDYDWQQNVKKYTTAGTYTVTVEDKKESSNRGQATVVVGDLESITHHIALNSSRSISSADAPAEGDCPYFKSRGSEWPALSKLLPTKDAFKHNLSKYYMIRGRTYVLMGLAKVRGGGYVPPHLHERISFNMEKVQFIQDPFLSALLVTPVLAGEFPVEARFRKAHETFTVVVNEQVTTVPSDTLLLTSSCQIEIAPRGGSGSYRSRYRVKSSGTLASGTLVSVRNWTHVQTNAGSSETMSEDGRFYIWDEFDEANRVELSVAVRGITGFRMAKKHYYVMEGAVLRVDVQGLDDEGQRFHCCSNTEGSWEEIPIGEEDAFLFRAENGVGRMASSCASADFVAVRVGQTRIRFVTSRGRFASAHVTIFPRLRLDPEVAVLTSGSSVSVRILGGPSPAEVSVKGDNAALSMDRFHLEARCPPSTNTAGQSYTATVRMNSVDAPELEVEATFTLWCIIPSHCRVDIATPNTWEALPQPFVASGSILRIITSVFGKNEQNITVPSWRGVSLTANGVTLSDDNVLRLPTGGGADGDFVIEATIPDLKFTCTRRFTMRNPMKVLPPVAPDADVISWMSSGCDARFHLQDGSGQFSVRSDTLKTSLAGGEVRDVIITEEKAGKARSTGAIHRVVISDLNMYPPTEVSRLVVFQPIESLSLKQTPEYIVQGSDILMELEPLSFASQSAMVGFDWSPYRVEHSSMEWEPHDAFELRKKLDARSFHLHALRTGNATIKYRLCSSCDPTRCISGEKRVLLEKFRSAAIFPGARYNLSLCDDLGPLSQCEVRPDPEIPSSLTGVVAVFPNGTVVSGCSEGRAVIRCAREDAVRSNVYFHIAVRFPNKIDWFTGGNASHWVVVPTNSSSSYQLHAGLSMGDSTCFVDYESERHDEWDFSIATEGRRTNWHTVRSSKSLASLAVRPEKAGVWKIGVKVTFGSLNATCKQFGEGRSLGQLRTERRFLAHDPPKLLSPGRLLLPSSSLFEIETKPKVTDAGGAFNCSLAQCGCEDFVLNGCTLQAIKRPAGRSICAVTIGSMFTGTDDFGSFQAFPYHIVLAEARSIATFSLQVERDYKLTVDVYDDVGRPFTQGWTDVLGETSRRLQFFPSRTVMVESPHLRSNQVNCSSKDALRSFQLSTTSRRSTGTLVAAMFENDVLIARALVDKMERKCNKLLANAICLDDAELLVISSVSLALIVAFLQGYRNKEVYIFAVLTTAYFAVV